jgi:hypothetical protein
LFITKPDGYHSLVEKQIVPLFDNYQQYEENAYFPQEKGRYITPIDRDSVCD